MHYCLKTLMIGVFLIISGIRAHAGRVDSLLNASKVQQNDSELVKTYIRLSASYYSINYDSAVYFGLKANKLAEDIGYRNGYSASFLRIGNAYNSMAQYDSASWAFNRALELFTEDGDKKKMASAYNNLGMLYRYQNDFAKSLDYFMKSLELKRESGNDIEIGAAYQNIGIVFAIKQEFKTATKYIEDAVDIFYKSGDSSKYYSSLIDLSSLYRDQQKYEKSLEILSKTYNYQKKMGNKARMGICIYSMGVASYLQGDVESSLAYNYQARELFKEVGNRRRMMACNLKIVNILMDMKQYPQAEKEAKIALLLFKELNSPDQEYEMLKMLSEIAEKAGKYKEALKYRLGYEHIKDSINEEEQHLKFVEIQNKYEKEKSKREIAELTASNKENLLLARNKQNENYVLLGVLVFSILLGGMWYTRSRNKKITNETLREKNDIIQHSLDEKEVLLREIHHRVQNNLQFVSSLFSLQSRRLKDGVALEVLKECRLRIQSMAMIHQKLYQESSLKGIDFNSYAKHLIDSLIQSYQIDSSKIETELIIDKILLDINTAIPMGLILNEIVTNSFKYAFNEMDQGLLTIRLYEKEGFLFLEIEDNGVGLPEGFDSSKTNSFGLKLVRSLAQKLKAEVNIFNQGGTKVVVQIKDYDKI